MNATETQTNVLTAYQWEHVSIVTTSFMWITVKYWNVKGTHLVLTLKC